MLTYYYNFAAAQKLNLSKTFRAINKLHRLQITKPTPIYFDMNKFKNSEPCVEFPVKSDVSWRELSFNDLVELNRQPNSAANGQTRKKKISFKRKRHD